MKVMMLQLVQNFLFVLEYMSINPKCINFLDWVSFEVSQWLALWFYFHNLIIPFVTLDFRSFKHSSIFALVERLQPLDHHSPYRLNPHYTIMWDISNNVERFKRKWILFVRNCKPFDSAQFHTIPRNSTTYLQRNCDWKPWRQISV